MKIYKLKGKYTYKKLRFIIKYKIIKTQNYNTIMLYLCKLIYKKGQRFTYNFY